MEQLAQDGMTMLLVTHEMGFARGVADTTVFMHQGTIWESGPSAELFAAPLDRRAARLSCARTPSDPGTESGAFPGRNGLSDRRNSIEVPLI